MFLPRRRRPWPRWWCCGTGRSRWRGRGTDQGACRPPAGSGDMIQYSTVQYSTVQASFSLTTSSTLIFNPHNHRTNSAIDLRLGILLSERGLDPLGSAATTAAPPGRTQRPRTARSPISGSYINTVCLPRRVLLSRAAVHYSVTPQEQGAVPGYRPQLLGGELGRRPGEAARGRPAPAQQVGDKGFNASSRFV